MERALQLNIALKMETAGNRISIEKGILQLTELRQFEGQEAKIYSIAKQVAETLATEFKLFKEIATEPSCDLIKLVATHMRMVRTFEVKQLTLEVSLCVYNSCSGRKS